MEKRRCGNSDIEVSVLGIGAWPFGGTNGDYWGPQDQKDVDRVVRAALDRGTNLFDTAEIYNGGRSEESLGKALGGRRAEAVIETKIAPSNCSPAAIREHCDASLRRLKTDCIDIYLVHWPVRDFPVPGVFETLAALQRDGKIRSIGVSNFGVRQLTEALQTGARIDVNQMHYSLFARAIEIDVVPLCLQHDVGVEAYMPLLQGLLAGKYKSADEIPQNRRRTRHFNGHRPGCQHGEPGAEKECFEALAEIRGIAEREGLTMSDLALGWTAAKPGIVSVLVGVRNMRQLEANTRGCSLKLAPDLIAELDRLTDPVLQKLGSNPDYWQGGQNARIC
jgi:aryl-alcohol dehydrogenase-like predicted oxidoreductase